MDDQRAISITQAMNHIQSWFNAGEYDKVIQGCAEILELEPGSTRALALMKMAEERRHESTMGASTAAASTYDDPLSNLQVEKTSPAPEESSTPKENRFSNGSSFEPESLDKRRLFMAMLLPAILVVVLGGCLIWYLSDRDREDTIASNSNSNITNVQLDTAYLDENEERVEKMTEISKVIEEYRQSKGKYPEAADLERVLVESDLFSEVPEDPKQGENDAEGKPFGYMYAVYDSKFGKSNQYYILSALFEDSEGVGYEWNVGESVKNYDDYRDISSDNVTFIGSSK